MNQARITISIDPELEPLIPAFLIRRQHEAQALRNALCAGDFRELGRIGHSMKGTGSGFGFHEITAIGEDLEAAAREADAAAVERLLARLDTFLQRVHVVYG